MIGGWPEDSFLRGALGDESSPNKFGCDHLAP